jgi:predicted membrane-bound spermidine synthase
MNNFPKGNSMADRKEIPSRFRIYLIFFLIGLTSLVGQILCIREMLVVFYGSELAIGVFYAAWFLWISAGALMGGYVSSRSSRHSAILEAALYQMVPCLLLQVFLFRNIHNIIPTPPWEIIPLGPLFLSLFICTAPFSFIVGMVFPLAVRPATDLARSRVVGIYIAEAVGILAGGLAFTFILVKFLSVVPLVISLGLIMAAGLLLLNPSPIRRALLPICYLLFFIILAFTPLRQGLSDMAQNLRWQSLHPGLSLAAETETPYQHLAVGKFKDQYSLLGDGKFIQSFPDPAREAGRAAVFFCQRPGARRILLISSGALEMINQLEAYPFETLDYVDLDPKAIELARRFYPNAEKVLADARLQLHFMDARTFVLSEKSAAPYDLVIVDLPDPATAYLNRYFTVEFYEDVRNLMDPAGVLVTRASSGENYLGEEIKSYNASIYTSLKVVFPQVIVTPGEEQIIIAGNPKARPSYHFRELKDRYLSLPLTRRVFPADGFYSLLPPTRVEFANRAMIEATAPANTDLRPITYYLNALFLSKLSGSRIYSLLKGLEESGPLPYLTVAAVFLLIGFMFQNAHPNPRRDRAVAGVVAMGFTGMAAMALEIILIFTYQSFFGYLYERIGLIAALFMLGMALGGLIGRALIRGRSGLILTLVLLANACLLFVLGPVLNWTAMLEGALRENIFFVLISVSGLATGVCFPLALAMIPVGARGVGPATGLIVCADHVGAALGGAVTATLFIPLLGIALSAAVVGGLLLLTSFFTLRAAFLPGEITSQLPEHYSTFRMPAAGYLVAAIAISAFLIGFQLRPAPPEPKTRFSAEVLQQVSGSDSFAESTKPFLHYKGFKGEAGPDSVSLSSMPLAAEIYGYGGPINLLISLDAEGNIRGVRIVEHNETPSYIGGVEEWLKQFAGLDVKSGIELGPGGVDAISRATISSQAIVDSVNLAGKAAASEILDLPVSAAAEAKPKRFLPLAVLLFMLAALIPVYYSRRPWLRNSYLAGVVVVMGFYLNIPFTVFDIGSVSLGMFPPWGHLAWYLQAVIILALLILLGPVYCGYLCPFGALQELLSNFLPQRPLNQDLQRRMRFLKYAVLAFALSYFWIIGVKSSLHFSPQQYFFSLHLSARQIFLIALLLIAGLFYWRFWCRYLCPAGAFLSLFNKIALLRKLSPERNFNNCPYQVAGPDDIDCLRCNHCRMSKGVNRS